MSEKSFEEELKNKPDRPIPSLENPDSDTERLLYLQRKLSHVLREQDVFKLSREMQYRNAMGAIRELCAELENYPRLREYIQEVEVYLDAARYILSHPRIIKYKRELKKGNPSITPEVVEEQKKLREDIIEWTDFIKWYIVQNERKPEYVHALLSKIHELWSNLGFADARGGLERGIFQELASYRILKEHFSRVRSGVPREDARHSIDFWAEDKEGNTFLFQSKSSSSFRRAGVFDKREIAGLKEEMVEKEGDDKTRSDIFDGNRQPDSERLAGIEEDLAHAESYASSRGAKNPRAFLLVVPQSNFHMNKGRFSVNPPRSVTSRLSKLTGEKNTITK